MLTRLLSSLSLGAFLLAGILLAPVAYGQMPQPDTSQLLSSEEVDEQQVKTAARIAVSVRKSTQGDQMKLRKDMQKKYPNPQQMDSTEKARARNEMRQRQMKIRKKQMKVMQQQANEEGMSPKLFQRIMRSAQRDSTLRQRLQTALKMEMKNQGMQMPQRKNPPNQPN